MKDGHTEPPIEVISTHKGFVLRFKDKAIVREVIYHLQSIVDDNDSPPPYIYGYFHNDEIEYMDWYTDILKEERACNCHRCIEENGLTDKMVMGGEEVEVSQSIQMILCPVCGNKRCPKASDHRLACTGSNEPGQEGSVYE